MTLERAITDAIYQVLFGADAATLRARLGLPEADTPDDDRLRDEMSERALRYLAKVEELMTAWLRLNHGAQPMEQSVAASRIAEWYAEGLKKVCAEEAVDVLTGNPL